MAERINIPAVGELLHHPKITPLIGEYGRPVLTHALRSVLGEERTRQLNGRPANPVETLIEQVQARIDKLVAPSLRPVINATGIILHTNLGRAILGPQILADLEPVVCGYSNLEFDLETGKRGDRNDHVAEILRFLTGAEDALVVNNNAAALVLILNTLSKNRETLISRGELIEIGGSFRLPEIMESAGSKMVEVGATNRTRLSDFETAITSETALLLKAHTSNFTIEGFTEEVSVKELAALAHSRSLPMVYDIGSGLLCKPEGLPLPGEPDIRSSLADGADLVCFSCDKLLGGPQGGVIAGKADLIQKLAKAPLMRAFRVGKLTLAAVESASRNYLSKEKLLRNNPTFALLNRSPEEIEQLAEKLARAMTEAGLSVKIVDSPGRSGGGTLSNVSLPGKAVALEPANQKASFSGNLAQALLEIERPILGILREGTLLFDVRTLFEHQLSHIAQAVATLIRKERP